MTTTATVPSQTEEQNREATDLIVRSAPMAASGLDEKTRSISCVLSTETPVRMFDWNSYEHIDEVLRADGGQFPTSLPLLDNHSRYSSLDVVGSAREIKTSGNQSTGRVYFAEGIDRSEQIYQLVRQGHLTDVSIGYRYTQDDYVEIQRGQTATVGGTSYTAKERTLRIVTRWEAKELSVTPIGADKLAKMRSLSDCKFGHANEQDKISKVGNSDTPLGQHERQDKPKMPTEIKTEVESTRTEGDATKTTTTPATAGAVSGDAIRSDAVEKVRAEERDRVIYAQSFAAQGVRTELVDEAIKEGWDRAKINERFLQAITVERKEPIGTDAKNISIHSKDGKIRSEEIQAVFLMRAGVDLEHSHMSSRCHEATFCRGEGEPGDMSWAVRAAKDLERKTKLSENAERALEYSYKYRSISLVQACAMALDSVGVRYNRYDERDIVTRAVSTMSVVALMSNALGASILEAFVGAPDTTGWVAEQMNPNNLPQPIAKAGMVGRLTKRVSGQTPKPNTRDATEEFISTATYSSQLFIDRIDLLADRFGTIENTPQEIGRAARELRPDLVYSTLLLNPTMGDGNALFSTAHSNVATSAALGPETLAARKTAMATQTNNGRLIQAIPGTLLVPESRSHYADELLGSSEKRDTTASTVYGTKNWAKGKYNLVSEARLDVGCENPTTGEFVAGRAQDYYLIEQAGRFGLVLAMIRAAGGGPIIENWTPGDGRIGVGTTVEMDLGIAAAAWEGLQCGTGAGSR